MSEQMNTQRWNMRRALMVTASALALGASLNAAGRAQASDTDRPLVWIELGAQSEQVEGFGDPFDPPFTPEIISDGFNSPLKVQRALSQSFGENGTVSFQPENSDWIFSASVRYGRANGNTSKHEQTPNAPRHVSVATPSGGVHTAIYTRVHLTAKFSDTRANNDEAHAILDFQAGKDIGLGLFSGKGKSTFSFGVRVAQFTSKQTLGLIADPDFYFPKSILVHAKYHHTYTVTSNMERSFRGVGPSISWNASAPLIGGTDNSGITLDGGINAAFLFGRQKAQGHHQTVGTFSKSIEFLKYKLITHMHRSGNPDRSRFIAVPNVGGFAGLSFLYSSAKVSLGYRADLFFGAMDGGIDTRKSENVGFYGPFASVSVGFGG